MKSYKILREAAGQQIILFAGANNKSICGHSISALKFICCNYRVLRPVVVVCGY